MLQPLRFHASIAVVDTDGPKTNIWINVIKWIWNCYEVYKIQKTLKFTPYMYLNPVQLTLLVYPTRIFSIFVQPRPSVFGSGRWWQFAISLQFETCEPHAFLYPPIYNFTICTIIIFHRLYSYWYMYKASYFIFLPPFFGAFFWIRAAMVVMKFSNLHIKSSITLPIVLEFILFTLRGVNEDLHIIKYHFDLMYCVTISF